MLLILYILTLFIGVYVKYRPLSPLLSYTLFILIEALITCGMSLRNNLQDFIAVANSARISGVFRLPNYRSYMASI